MRTNAALLVTVSLVLGSVVAGQTALNRPGKRRRPRGVPFHLNG
ncbi:hypothetical protein C8E05_0745 [Rhodococcus wratislaviensis]|uniref:Uncharacterized protein n=1 Tax=Rhodococcus wratislaviensis TaxID=44752 RepID=A0AB38FP13_RHOWR|nr:hypothetical protein [Rhodococcus wratislaviensis]REE71389.1 hypothetical protein C8E05_0745 [Rhodococcus wratislaviensis]SPZ43281.1 Uncharacterised protein [Rhodococcus wratislaviensis]